MIRQITFDIKETELKDAYESDLMRLMLRATQYDRDQYDKGYKDGTKDLEEQAKYHFVNCCELLGMTVRIDQTNIQSGFDMLFSSNRYGRQFYHHYVVSNTSEFWSRWNMQYEVLKTADRSMEELAKKAAMASVRASYTYQQHLELFYAFIRRNDLDQARWFLGRILEANGVAHADKVAANIV